MARLFLIRRPVCFDSRVRAFFFSILGYFLTPAGIILMGALDASMVFFLPLGIDFVVIVMTARKPELFWLYAILATIGSLAGAAGTYWIGKKAGEKGLTRLISPRRLDRVKARVGGGAYVIAGLALIPPPFPFTPFVLASGALGMNPWGFFGALAGARLFRFGVEGALAYRYGSQILRWMKTPTFQAVVGTIIVLAVIGTIVSAVIAFRGSRVKSGSAESPQPPRGARAAPDPR
jgi:membrane protein YqaA with SNARE-associated domain